MKNPKGYIQFLEDIQDDLAELLRVSEDEGWHHLDIADDRSKCYTRLLTWMDEVEDRRRWYYAGKGKVYTPSEARR